MSERPVVFITGAAGGIGSATCVEFARRGYDLAMADVDEKKLQKLMNQIDSEETSMLPLAGDLADLEYAESSIKKTVEHFGRIDVLVNNATWREIKTMRTISLESWEKTMRVGVTAPAFLSRWAAAEMEKRGKGVIINISSIQSQSVAGISPAYVASKGALDALTYELATLWGPKGIRVLAVNPGAIDTDGSRDYESNEGDNLTTQLRKWSEEMIPLRRWGRAEEIARTICMLCSEDASYLTGTTIVADGGVKMQFSPYPFKHQMFPQEY